MNLTTTPHSNLSGSIVCPGDKSISQRAVIIGALMNQDLEIEGFLHAQDPLSTVFALNQMGAGITIDQSGIVKLTKRSAIFTQPSAPLDLGNSGTGLRLLLGVAAGLGHTISFNGDVSLSKRPMKRVIDPLLEMGANMTSADGMLPISVLPSTLRNKFLYELPVASAQVKSAVLLAGLASGNAITVVEPIQTRDHTERMLKSFGVNLEITQHDKKNIISLYPGSFLEPKILQVVGDISSAAFLIVGALISKSKKLHISNVGMNPSRTGLLDVLRMMGANIEIKNSRIQSGEPVADLVILESSLKGVEIAGNIIPNIIDEIPILSIAAAFADGNTLIKDAAELRVKESDRLLSISKGFEKLGIKHENFDDGMRIFGNNDLSKMDGPVSIDSYDDHRIAMSFLIAGIKCSSPIEVKECDNILTSFPNFTEITSSLGYAIA